MGAWTGIACASLRIVSDCGVSCLILQPYAAPPQNHIAQGGALGSLSANGRSIGRFRKTKPLGSLVLAWCALSRQPPPDQHKQHSQRKVNAAEVQIAMVQPPAAI